MFLRRQEHVEKHRFPFRDSCCGGDGELFIAGFEVVVPFFGGVYGGGFLEQGFLLCELGDALFEVAAGALESFVLFRVDVGFLGGGFVRGGEFLFEVVDLFEGFGVLLFEFGEFRGVEVAGGGGGLFGGAFGLGFLFARGLVLLDFAWAFEGRLEGLELLPEGLYLLCLLFTGA